MIQQLESFGSRFKSEYKTNVDLNYYNDLVESSKKQLAEYQHCLNLFSVENEQREEKCKGSDKLSRILQPNLTRLKTKLFSDSFLTYAQMEKDIKGFFGKLIHRVSK